MLWKPGLRTVGVLVIKLRKVHRTDFQNVAEEILN